MARPKHSYIGVDNTAMQTALQVIKETDARSRVMFTKLHNMQVEMSELKLSLHRLISMWLEDRPADMNEAQAVIANFLKTTKTRNEPK